MQVKRGFFLGAAAALLAAAPLWAGWAGPYKQGLRACDYEQWEKAASYFEQALRAKSEEGERIRLYGVKVGAYLPHFYLGLAYFKLGRNAEALREWEISQSQGAIAEHAVELARLERYRDEARSRLGEPVRIAELPPPSLPRPAARPRPPSPLPSPSPSASGEIDPRTLGIEESYALVVGASEYRGAWPSLPGVAEDVDAVARALAAHGFTVSVLRDPTKAALVAAMDDLFYIKPRREASRLLFYYAGHGFTVDEDDENEPRKGYLVPVDAPAYYQAPREFVRSAIPMRRFQEYLYETRARHVMFLFDSCFSGTVFETMRSGSVPGSVEERVRQKSRVFLAAGEADQEVPDQSYFRRAFVEALDGAGDVNGDGVIFGSELADFIYSRVVDRFHGTDHPQTPRWGKSRDYDRGDFPFTIPPSRP